jgi:hypothetical protein
MQILVYNFEGKDRMLGVQFEYFPHEPGLRKDTRCEISLPVNSLDERGRPQFVTLSTGYAALHHRDQFNKKRGRKIAFARALQHGILDPKEREAVWKYNLEFFRTT